MPPNEKLQRWIDLMATLLVRRTGATFAQIVANVPAYEAALKTQTQDNFKRGIFERDKAELRELGVRIETLPADDDGETRYRLRASDFYLPYLALHAIHKPEGYRALPEVELTSDDLVTLADAIARLEQLGEPSLTGDAHSAANKLAFDLPLFATDPLDVRVLDASLVDERTFQLLGDALRRRKLVSFSYHKPDSDRTTERHVEPFGLFFVNGQWYLAAHDRTRGDVRNFRLSRMSAVKVNQKGSAKPDYDVPASFNVHDHACSRDPWDLGADDAIVAEVRFASSGVAVAAARAGEPVKSDVAVRRFTVRRLDVFARWLLSLAGDAVPLSPPKLVDAWRALARQTIELYRA